MAKKAPKKLKTGKPGSSLVFQVVQALKLKEGFRMTVESVGTGKTIRGEFEHGRTYTPGAKICAKVLDEKKKGLFLVEPEGGFDDPEAIDKQVKDFFRKIPKTEIHLHLEGVVRRETLLKLSQRDRQSKIKSMDDVNRLFNFKNLGEFIRVFIAVQNSIHEVKDFEFLFDDLRKYIKDNNIVYAEIFLAISKFVQKGFRYEDMVEILSNRIREFERKEGNKVRLIIDVGRTFGPKSAQENLERVLAHPQEMVLGIGLGGDEKTGAAPKFIKTFKQAIKNGLHVVAHAGEDVGPKSIWDAVKKLGAERIGHGLAAIEDPKLMQYLQSKKIPVEVCLTSNVFTGRYTRELTTHPVQTFGPKGMMVTVNSDDPTFFHTDLSTEYYYFHKYLHFPLSDILVFLENGVTATFHP
ncbi:MAG: adenosine deaminase, partial [Spirochaetia bacterium]|nr:adenosine deaminase [Spirochaetia bacterium]